MKNPEFPGPLPFGDSARACALLREVCSLASTGMRIAGRHPLGRQDDDIADDDLLDRIQVLRQTLGRIGWVADVALRKLGDTGAFATAEDWMLPEV